MAVIHHQNATQKELTSIVGDDKAATARALRFLEKKSLLTRKQDKRDRRQKRICTTAAAHEIADAVHTELLRLNREIMEGLTGQDQLLLSAALAVMETNLAAIRRKEE